MTNIIKILFLLLVLNSQMLFAESSSDKADKLYNQAQRLYSNAKYKEAIPLYEKSYELKPSKDIPANTGISYKNIGNYKKSIYWYKVGIKVFNDKKSIFNLGLLYEEKLLNIDEAIKWYREAINQKNLDAYDNISLIYHDIRKDNLTASAYYLATIEKSYTKKQILDFLKNDWKIDEATIKKAYHLQKTLVPNPYYDKEFEEKIAKKKSGRR
ncbi:MAG: hypothetical protein COB67_10460 [SAR324 cluster bacterium]|uniref:Beta-lactamase n=1 Tax=SAR324 cluster bacterium TaxID=2024889 RepID=A0A2A4SXF7_9DELT|nr:MAG: hypothetical protein COB67_10460 [SAR324 cluster bacterium]